MLKGAELKSKERTSQIENQIELSSKNYSIQKEMLCHLNKIYHLRLYMVCINEMSAGMGEKKLDFCFPIKLAKNSLLSNIFQKNGNSNKLLSELYHEYNFFKELIVLLLNTIINSIKLSC